MIPPWDKYPDIQVGRIGWRMGRGEDYYNEFYKWFSALEEIMQIEFAEMNPEPDSWIGFYDKIKNYPWC